MRLVYSMILCACLAACLYAVPALAADSPDMLTVQVREGQVRSKPSFLAKIIATLKYGDKVEPLEEKDGWSRVSIPDTQTRGWLHTSALTDEELELQSGAGDAAVSASGEETALAGKGFTEQVENEYRKSHEDLNYSAVDAMEKITINDADLAEFLKQGEVQPQEVE